MYYPTLRATVKCNNALEGAKKLTRSQIGHLFFSLKGNIPSEDYHSLHTLLFRVHSRRNTYLFFIDDYKKSKQIADISYDEKAPSTYRGAKEARELFFHCHVLLQEKDYIEPVFLQTAQEHFLQGGSCDSQEVGVFYTPEGLHLQLYSKEKIINARRLQLVNLGLIYYFHEKFEGKFYEPQYYLFEQLDTNGSTKKDPRPISIEKLNLLEKEENLDSLSIDEIYDKCKISFEKNKDFPYKRD